MPENSTLPSFHIKDCTLAPIATGIKAQTLAELRDRLLIVPHSSLYYHFWGGRLRTTFEHREFRNDFSYWAHHCLHDDFLAERLEILNPREFDSLDGLTEELLDIIDNRLDEIDYIPLVKREEQFHFIRSKIVIFGTNRVINHPSELKEVFLQMTRSSLFYHFIDSATRLPDKKDDFSEWLKGQDGEYKDLISQLHKIDPYLITLSDLQERLNTLMNDYFNHK